MTKEQWINTAKRLLKAELKRAEVNYEELSRRLIAMGVEETEASIASKMSRGTFSAAFMLAALKAIDRKVLALSVE